jgi:hypothetical protein
MSYIGGDALRRKAPNIERLENAKLLPEAVAVADPSYGGIMRGSFCLRLLCWVTAF